MEPDLKTGNGIPSAGRDARPEISEAALFVIVWDALSDTLGTAAAAALVRRAAQRASAQRPEIAGLVIARENFEYRYTLPGEWEHNRQREPAALRVLIREIGRLLMELTGTVVIRRLEELSVLRSHDSSGGRKRNDCDQAGLDLLSTGSTAFDRILGGGLPTRSVNVLAGEPGAGKTILALQMLFHEARQGRKCLYLTTLSEPSLRLFTYMQQFSFFDEKLTGGDGVVFADIGSVVRRKGIEETLTEITSRIEQEHPALVVIDSFKAMQDLLGEPSANRTFVYDLAVHISVGGGTSILVGEYTAEEIANLPVFAIADGIIRLSNQRRKLRAVREVEVLKLRGANVVTGGHFFEIGDDGLTFFPRVRSPEGPIAEPPIPGDRVSTGVAGLDEMLGGGLPRASATVIQGGTGTGKTFLGLQFLLAGARSGEPGVLFTLEETANQLRSIAHGFGWELRPLEDRGLLAFCYVSPVELSTDRFLDQARQEVERRGARRAVLDSLTSMALGVPSQRRFKELVYAVSKHFRAAGVTLNMNMEIADLLGSARLSGYGVSFAADNVIQLKYVEVEGHLERAVAVLKARGVRHATDARRLIIGDGRIDVQPAYAGLRGVLTGLPVPRAEEDR